MKKKWIAWLLALTMLFSLVPTAFAAGEQPAQSGLVFWLDGQLNTGSGFDSKAASWTDLASGNSVSLTLDDNCAWDAAGKGLAIKATGTSSDAGTYVALPAVVTNAINGGGFTTEIVVSAFSFKDPSKKNGTPLLRANNDKFSDYISAGDELRSKG